MKHYIAIFIISSLALVFGQRPSTYKNPYYRDYSDVVITRSEFDKKADSFHWATELSDQTRHEQTGELRSIGEDEVALQVTGSYSYYDPLGEFVEVRYIADENGFQAEGSHLPVAPTTEAPQALPVRLLAQPAARSGTKGSGRIVELRAY